MWVLRPYKLWKFRAHLQAAMHLGYLGGSYGALLAVGGSRVQVPAVCVPLAS